MAKNRFFVGQQIDAKTPEENFARVQQNLRQITESLNGSKFPISLGPDDQPPEGLMVGQPVIDWRSGASVLKVWNGKELI